MKYIVLSATLSSDTKLEMPVIFPEKLVHRIVADEMVACLQKHFPDCPVTVVSAGFISSTVFGKDMCHGESESLAMHSRGAEDDLLLQMND